jgi:hypothetical protein
MLRMIVSLGQSPVTISRPLAEETYMYYIHVYYFVHVVYLGRSQTCLEGTPQSAQTKTLSST